AESEVLRRFRRESHEVVVNEFRRLDKRAIQMANASIVRKAAARRPETSAAALAGSEGNIVLREGNKKSRLLPIRKLFRSIPNVLFSIKPCLLMSPISVSQFLDPELHKFDIVIFDEASQMCSEDAIGAIYRGKQLIVAGDSKQLPPTRFFKGDMADDYESEEEDEDSSAVFESILDECSSIGMLPLSLRWHYRSRHESLIAFSNHYLYDNRLVTFPSSVDSDDHLGVKFNYVANGVYDRGKGSEHNNRIEAEYVANLVFEQLKSNPKKTLGVVAFSQSQKDAIENALEPLRRRHPEFESHFRRDRLEEVFVKNLETVQGDERDVLIISVGYGRDVNGKMSVNFGPLNKAGGERRLNVLISRAREKVALVSSIKAQDIDVNSTQAQGAILLHRYLDFAENGPAVLQRGLLLSCGEAESPLESDVAGVIRGLGYDCVYQVGCSSYRIDIGVLDPGKPGRYLLGVECDGAMYHSAHTARDRDRLRQEVLENLGWTIHRIWSADWASRRDTEIGKLQAAIIAARDSLEIPEPFSETISHDEPELSAELDDSVEYEVREVPEDCDIRSIPGAQKYETCALPYVRWMNTSLSDPSNRRCIAILIRHLVENDGPIHIEHSSKRIAEQHGTKRVGSRIQNAIRSAIADCRSQGVLKVEGEFLWPAKMIDPAVRFPCDSDENTERPLDWVCDKELRAAIILLLKHFGALSPDSLARCCAQCYGFQRTGHSIQERLTKLMSSLRRDKIVLLRNGKMVLSQPSETDDSMGDDYCSANGDGHDGNREGPVTTGTKVHKHQKVLVNGLPGMLVECVRTPGAKTWMIRVDGEANARKFVSPPARVEMVD
ncbi:MAG: DUF3320 domain-containing protein, partial [Candidatus Marsarchaeota archaeon]|nr:DUF3320 domain-containing protein [Candidatus Marsarchaeota archaeon]